MAYLYTHTRLDKNEVFYVGIGSDDNFIRANSKYGRNKIWKRIANKTSYQVNIILNNIDWNTACIEEIKLISKYGRLNLKQGSLCNLTDGGDGSLGVIFSEENKAKRSLKFSGSGNPMYGKKFSEEYKKKLSLAKIGKPMHNKTKVALANAKMKKVIDTNTNIIYNSVKEIANTLNVPATTMTRWLRMTNKPYKLL